MLHVSKLNSWEYRSRLCVPISLYSKTFFSPRNQLVGNVWQTPTFRFLSLSSSIALLTCFFLSSHIFVCFSFYLIGCWLSMVTSFSIILIRALARIYLLVCISAAYIRKNTFKKVSVLTLMHKGNSPLWLFLISRKNSEATHGLN